jgi:glyoxylase-like metal-dependent hydrolase (beta-lactamase superfamily II)
MTDSCHSAITTLPILYKKMNATINAYLIRGEGLAVIDTGPPLGSKEAVEAVLKAADAVLADIDMILLTHGHFDHIGGGPVIKDAGRAQLMIHHQDALYLDDQVRAFDLFMAPLHKALGREGCYEEDKADFLRNQGPRMAVDRRLEDNDVIDLGRGVRLQVVHLPGHTPGSVGYYWPQEEILLAGDAVPGLNTPGGMLPIIYDLKAYALSLQRLIQMPVRCLMQCHPYRGIQLPPAWIRQGEQVGKFLEDALRFAQMLSDAVQRHADEKEEPLMAVGNRIIAELPEELGFLPLDRQPAAQFSLMTLYYALSQGTK